jgi:predicted ATP-binding protein involved in virulence
MHHISRVSVEGFWDTHDFELNLFPQVTFLIGPNGTGKTTLINLIAAALTADFPTLDRIPFRRIVIHLASDRPDGPRISVVKTRKKERPFDLIEYRLKGDGRNASERRYSLDHIEEQMLMRRYPADSRMFRDMYRFMPSELNERIRELVQVNWLSVHRASAVERPREERSYESTVDQKIEAISNEIVRYFSTLSQRKDDEVRQFQESMFVSLVENQSHYDLFDKPPLEEIDKQIDILSFIFDELHVSKPLSDTLLQSFRLRGAEVERRLKKRNDGSMAIDDAIYVLGLKRISAIIDRWNSLQERLTSIFAPRDKWIRITNQLLQRKEMELTASNEIQFKSRSGKTLKTGMLSSGEKQLLILLSETLLQRERPAIFIADEPELSLHVLWQERLVASLRALNPAAQIIAATHSPDIVGNLSKHTIDMETLIP